MSLLVNKLRLGKKSNSLSKTDLPTTALIATPPAAKPASTTTQCDQATTHQNASSSSSFTTTSSINLATNDPMTPTSDKFIVSHESLPASTPPDLPTPPTSSAALQYYANYVQQSTSKPSIQHKQANLFANPGLMTSSSRGSTTTVPGAAATLPISSCMSVDFDSPLVPEWGKLIPLLPHIYPSISLNREKFVIGRHFSCHCRFNLSEISSKHVYLWRERRDSDGLWQVLIDDQSTNGSFLNNRSIGKNQRKVVRHNDELAFGRKFTGRRHVPVIGAFLDWMFIGTSQAQEYRSDIDRAKQIASFHVLVTMTDHELENFGIKSELVREKILVSVSNWKHDHRFPAYRVELVDAHLYAPGDLNLITTSDPTLNYSNSTVIPNTASPSTPGPVPPRTTMIDQTPFGPPLTEDPHQRSDTGSLGTVIARLVALYPKTDLDTITVVTKYERLIAGHPLSANELELRAAVKLAEITGISPQKIYAPYQSVLAPTAPRVHPGPPFGTSGDPANSSSAYPQGHTPASTAGHYPTPIQSLPVPQQQLLAQLAMAQMAMMMPLFTQQQQQQNHHPNPAAELWQSYMQCGVPVSLPAPHTAPPQHYYPHMYPQQPHVDLNASTDHLPRPFLSPPNNTQHPFTHPLIQQFSALHLNGASNQSQTSLVAANNAHLTIPQHSLNTNGNAGAAAHDQQSAMSNPSHLKDYEQAS